MKRNLCGFIFVVFMLLVSSMVSAQDSKIVLSDNTVIYGKVTGMSDGVYTIETSSMGAIKVNSDNVISITKGGASNNSTPSRSIEILEGNSNQQRQQNNNYNYQSQNDYSNMQGQATQKVQSMMLNGNFMDSMMNLSESSLMSDVMNDPEIMDAISRGDYDFLMNNSKMKSLMESQEIQGLLGGM